MLKIWTIQRPFTCVTPLSLKAFRSEISWQKEEVCFAPWFCPIVVTTLLPVPQVFSSFILSHRKGRGEHARTNMAQRVVWAETVVCHEHILLSVSQFLALRKFLAVVGVYFALPFFFFSVLGSITQCFLHWAASGPSMHVLHLQYGNNISCLAETLARWNDMMLRQHFDI